MKTKIIEVVDKATVELRTRQARYFRERVAKKGAGYFPGLGSYALYGVKDSKTQTYLIGDAATSADFAEYVTAKAKAAELEKCDALIEYRETNKKPTVRVWIKDKGNLLFEDKVRGNSIYAPKATPAKAKTRPKSGDVKAYVAANPDKTIREVADALNVRPTTAWTTAKRLQIKLPTPGRRATHEINGHKMSKLKHDRIMAFKAQLPQLDEAERLNANDIAARLGCSGSNVRFWLRILGHRLHNNNGRTIYKHDTTTWPKVFAETFKDGTRINGAAKRLGVCYAVAYRYAANAGLIVVNERDHNDRKSANPY